MPRSTPPSDCVIIAKRCHASFATHTKANAIVVQAGRIAKLGPSSRLLKMRGRGVQVLDLHGATITPGLVDCHTHLLYWALWRRYVADLSDCYSLDDALHVIRRHARRRLIDGWVLGAGFDPNRWAGGFPTAGDLDRAAPDVPAIIRSRDVHSAWLNTRALRLAGITHSTPDPAGGRIMRDAHGEPTGILQETATEALPDPIGRIIRSTDPAARRMVDAALDAGEREAWKHGIVGVHTMDYGESFTHLARRRAAGRLGLRVAHALALARLDQAIEIGLRSGIGDDWLRIGGVKIFSDGSLGSQTAYMFDAYPDTPDNCGVPVVAGEELKQAASRANRHGLAVWVHAIGDRAVSETIDAIVAAQRNGRPAIPNRIEHAQCVRPRDMRRIARAGLIASVQPCHVLGDIPTAQRHWPRAQRNAYPFRSLLAAGAVLAAGSDIPVESIDPRRSLHGAVSRTDEQLEPAGGWFPKQRLTIAETLHAFTAGAAAAIGGLFGPGTLEPGAPADLTVWDDDPLNAAPDGLLDIGIRGCIVNGEPRLR
jgi:hypothetical protein